MRKAASLLALLFITAAAARAWAQPLPVDLRTCDIRIQKGNFLFWSDPSFDDSSWQKTALPSNWAVSPFPGYKGVCWYRIRFTLAQTGSDAPLAVSLGKIRDKDDVYLNRTHIGSKGNRGRISSHAEGRMRIYELPDAALRQGENILAVRVESSLPGGGGILSGPFSIDRYDRLLRNHAASEIVKVLLVTFFLTCGIFLVFYYARKKRDSEILLFGILNLLSAVIFFTVIDLPGVTPDAFSVMRLLRYSALFAAGPIYLAAVTRFFKQKSSALHLLFYITSSVCILLGFIFPDPLSLEKILRYFYLESFIIPLVLGFTAIIPLLKFRASARAVLPAQTILTASIIADCLTDRFIITLPSFPCSEILFIYGAAVFLGTVSGVFINRAHLLGKNIEEKKKQLEKTVQERDLAQKRIGIAYMEAVNRLASTAEMRDPETENHIRRISCYSLLLANAACTDKETAGNIFYASPMHDVGKVGIPDEILFKESSLSEKEWEVMKTHTIIGAKIFETARSPVLETARDIALTHHEKFDGTGYPSGLRGAQIPLSGRIMALADAYDALRSRRPFKEEMTHKQAEEIILKGDGRIDPAHFDPQLIKIFEENSGEFDRIYEQYKD